MRDRRKAAGERGAVLALEPLSLLLAELGFSVSEAESLLRSVFVHALYRREFRATGEPPTVSRIALLAGMQRKQVDALLRKPPGIDTDREAHRHRAIRILNAWHEDADFLDAERKPLVLLLKSSLARTPSFTRLVERYAPFIYPKLILDELLRVGAVRRLPDDTFKVCSRTYGDSDAEVKEIEALGQLTRDVLGTLTYNLKNPREPLPCESAVSIEVDEQWVPALRNTWGKRLATMMKAIQADLDCKRVKTGESKRKVRMGVTALIFESPSFQGASDEAEKKKQRRRK